MKTSKLKKHKKRLYTVIIVFIILSFISVTYAWFTFSGIIGLGAEVDVKAWYIEFNDGDTAVSNNITITSKDIYPGMETVYEEITIDNKGDTNAIISIIMHEARVLNIDHFSLSDTTTSESIEDAMAHDYPFKINIVTEDNLVEPQTKGKFTISISWPADSGDDILDTYWGQEAYKFNLEEQAKLDADPDYQRKNPIELRITVLAEQDVKEASSFDENYQLGKTVLMDVVNNTSCSAIGGNCIKTTVIESNNKIENQTVALIPDIKDTYQTSTYANYNATLLNYNTTWSVNTRALTTHDILNIISKDVENTVLTSPSTSNIIVGNITTETRANSIMQKAISLNGQFEYSNAKYSYLDSVNCVWTTTEYNTENAFAIANNTSTSAKLYSENKNTTCKVVPVIIADKSNLQTN